jgi:hypothetical protein
MSATSSLFAQLLQIIPLPAFQRIVREEHGERHAKGFTCRMQLVAMLYLQLALAKSLAEICDGLRLTCGKLNHLGITAAPAKSSLAYANEHRSAKIYERLFYTTLEQADRWRPGKKKRFRFRHRLLSIDSTTLELCANLFPWAHYQQRKGAAKVHLVLDHDGYLPTYAVITDGNTSDISVARLLTFPKGSIVVMDRGYTDYAQFQVWTRQGVYFVTRLRDNAVYTVERELAPPSRHGIITDQLVRLSSPYARERCQCVLRRIVAQDASGEQVVLLTNHLALGATTVSAIYRDRWEIEIFFRTIKQCLRIKTFVGTSANALAIQIWTALIALLLIAICRFRSTFGWHLSRLLALLRVNLFTYRHLWDWLNNPFRTPPISPPEQLMLGFWTAGGSTRH